ncbi:hypothetical protein DL96DRAFT_1765677 [Flagelloscypha sp. PMI_526]|nr:hypothetical protein DL96DRAFT_1765677 [Flagelloscypha sp. PMI_526]
MVSAYAWLILTLIMERSNSNDQTGLLPIEILEYIISFLSDDYSTLAACSLSSSVLLPASRATRFHTVTVCPPLGDSPMIPPFHTMRKIIKGCPNISQYVRRIRILNPENIRTLRPMTDEFSAAIHTILPQLVNVTRATVFSHYLFGGIDWSSCPWVLDALDSLPALEHITAEVYGSIAKFSASLSSQKVRGLMITAPVLDDYRVKEGSHPLILQPLDTFRVPLVIDENQRFLFSKSIGQSLDLSKLRHLAIGIRCSFRLFGTPLSSFAADCAFSLETLAFEISDPTICTSYYAIDLISHLIVSFYILRACTGLRCRAQLKTTLASLS